MLAGYVSRIRRSSLAAEVRAFRDTHPDIAGNSFLFLCCTQVNTSCKGSLGSCGTPTVPYTALTG